MKTGFTGTFVISWSQTELDGQRPASPEAVRVGSAWSWRGEALRLDGPADLLRLEMNKDEGDLRQRAARSVRRLVGAAGVAPCVAAATAAKGQLADRCFTLTNGIDRYTGTLIEVAPGKTPLLMFVDELPPRDTDLWVLKQRLCGDGQRGARATPDSGMICFTPGTLIQTPDGDRPVERLREGDRVLTRDNGPQRIQWIGARRMTGARLFVYPHLRPVRLRAGALSGGRPGEDLLVSPDHRLLLRGRHVQALFNTPEVLVAAKDLINGSSIMTDMRVREVTYVHLLLEDHQVLWANGVESESFHPANAALSALSDRDRQRLVQLLPAVQDDPFSYGAFARRNLNASEAAILRHEAA
ncbi:Hint domain-containing protein [Phaeobacter sp. QD34_3]|uniref:Hint domain-containing protein n=1 Tax=unclassified Phaeobacter TaxID=2621772 RepID=UPI00237FB316|nr:MULTISPECIES: Hint domain-containing protein [unclassified Phaeobacter]MDE4134972.1 Hint domain-containing protein [Phaeobacter sp. QD34_3]MDE4138602.1 Hint domain-containing protein [Phaeobacter sp. QD34_24]